MATQQEIYDEIRETVGQDLFDKFPGLSFAEMADVPDLAEWRDDLLAAERAWFSAGDAPGQGDDVPCVQCGAIALDTGLECTECGFDNYEAVTGHPFAAL